MPNDISRMMQPIEVPLGNGRRAVAKVRPHALKVSSGKLEVIVIDPPKPDAVHFDVGAIIGFVSDLIGLGKKIYDKGGGGQKCTSTLSQTTSPNGTITTTVTTTCEPA